MSIAAEAWRKSNGGAPLPESFVLAVRGYYSATIGEPGNDIDVYDDAFFIVSPTGITAWNGNTDPTRYGWNGNANDYMARLRTGCWWFISRMHRGRYQAFGQGDNQVTVDRIKANGTVSHSATSSDFGIDLHLGGINGTSSEGCQTVPPYQWEDFRRTLNALIRNSGVDKFPYILVDGPIN